MSGVCRTRCTMDLRGPGQDLLAMPLEYQAAVTEWMGPYSVQVPTATSEESITALGTGGLTTLTHLAISSDVAVSITYGTANVNVPVPISAGGFQVLAGTSLTAVAISNSSGSTALVRYMVAGS